MTTLYPLSCVIVVKGNTTRHAGLKKKQLNLSTIGGRNRFGSIAGQFSGALLVLKNYLVSVSFFLFCVIQYPII
jgi:hypothetical protein